MRTLMAVMTLLSAGRALADGGDDAAFSPPPPPPSATEQVIASPYWSTCRQIWTRSPYVGMHTPWLVQGDLRGVGSSSGSGSSGSSGTGSSGGGSSGGSGLSGGSGAGAGYAILALAVVALVALPIIVYAVDSEADPLTMERFYCPEFNFTANGGVQVPTGPGSIVGLGVAKIRADIGYLGGMAELGIMPSGNSVGATFSAHLLVRPPPKAHLEGALALGGRRAIGPGGALDGLEVALPHMYVFNRDGYKKMGLELMPRVFFNRSGIDVGADLSFVAPLADVLQVRVGIGAFSHAKQVQLTASAGLVAHL